MNKLKMNLPIYVLSASLVFVGVTSATQANSAPKSTYQVTQLRYQVTQLQLSLASFKRCANSNFNTISFYDASRNTRMRFISSCY